MAKKKEVICKHANCTYSADDIDDFRVVRTKDVDYIIIKGVHVLYQKCDGCGEETSEMIIGGVLNQPRGA